MDYSFQRREGGALVEVGEKTVEQPSRYMFRIYEQDRVVGGSEQWFDFIDALILKEEFEELGYRVEIIGTA